MQRRTVVGIKCKDGVVLVRPLLTCCSSLLTCCAASWQLAEQLEQGCEKTVVSKMLEEGSNKRTFAVDRHAGLVRRFDSLLVR